MLKSQIVNGAQQIFMPNLNTELQGVALKPLSSEDIDDFMKWATDVEVTKFMMWDTYTSRSEAETFFTTVVVKHPWFKAICLGNIVIGSITLEKGKGVHSCKAELGYVIAKKYWGNGHVTQAIKLALEKGFNDLNVHRIEANVDPDNIGSQRVLEKNGFVKEGHLRSCILHKGVVKDRFVYGILKPV